MRSSFLHLKKDPAIPRVAAGPQVRLSAATTARAIPGIGVTCALIMLLSVRCALADTGPTTRPEISTEKVTSSVDSQPIHREEGPAATPLDNSDPPRVGSMELPRVAGALAIVIGLIFLLRWGGQRLFNLPTNQPSTRAVKVLSRSVLAPKQQILLLQVGKRVLVVGDSGAQMTSLCEITDSDEIAALVGQVQEEKIGAPAGKFGSFFRRAKDDIGEEAEAPATPRADEPESPAAEVSEDAALASTRDELHGLMDKIRMVSRQFEKG